MHKINRFYIYSLLLTALFLHLTVLKYLRVFDVAPDILLSLVIFFGLFLGGRMGLEAGIAAGLLKDLFAFDIFGVNAFTLGATGLFVGALNTKFYKESKLIQSMLVFSFSIISMLLHFAVASFLFKSFHLGIMEYLFNVALPQTIYTTAISIPIYAKLITRFELREYRAFL